MEDAYGANGMSGMASDMANGSYGHSEFLSSANTAAVSGNSAVNGGVSSKYDPKGQATDQLDFSTLPAPTLRRYQRVHKLHYGKVRGGHREDLASAVTKHFNNQLVNELESIAWFIYAARSRDNELKLSQKPPT
ncbi:hypothetical protein BDF19DRAFT_449946 [Syncephalis fuscata]|nr:hypothetical protein BDF19DRAFT_449946 [Syncephalis fuscata]